MLRSGLSISIAFQNSGCSIVWNGRFEDIKNTINYSLQAAGVNLRISFTVEAYIYYQFVHLNIRIIHLPLLRIVIRVPDNFLIYYISYAQYDAKE
jgi:hypothetical protein